MEFFANPWFMAAGGALVASPILIHLINRMRFKRIRWAAMEFLLKSQKRNRRRLIIEQLILLLLRILLVLLAAFLLARYLYSGAQDEGGTQHVMVIDNGLSMTDHWREEGKSVTAFAKAKEEAVSVVKEIAETKSAQEMTIYLLSDLERPIFQGRLTTSSSDEVRRQLEGEKATAEHLSPSAGLVFATGYLKNQPQKHKVLHYIGDFRDNKWVSGPEGERTSKAVDETLLAGVNVNLLDVAFPKRSETQQVVNNHDNLAITGFRADTRIISEGMPVEFTVTLRNFSNNDKKTHLHIFVNGTEDFNGSKDTAPIKAQATSEEKFTLVLTKKKPSQDVRPTDPPDVREQKRRADQEYVRISAEITPEETGLQADNYRDMVIEVRKKVPVLLIDGNDSGEGTAPNGDVFHIQTVLQDSVKAYDIERRTVDELDKVNLDLYPSVYLLNVREIKSATALTKLADYVKRGGSLAYFLGPKTFVPFYNEKLHKEYNGLFPVLLQSNPAKPLEDKEREALRNDPQPKIIFKMKPRDAEKAKETIGNSNPESIIVHLASNQAAFRWLLIERYFPAQPKFQWDTDRSEPVQELIVLPNRNEASQYNQQLTAVLDSAVEQSKALAAINPKFSKYARAVNEVYRIDVTNKTRVSLFDVAAALYRMLNDPLPTAFLDEEDAGKAPYMSNLWREPSMQQLGERIKSLIDTLRYGDPLVVARSYGKGRIVACLTPAGTSAKWNDWGQGSPISFTYVPFIMDLQQYLSSSADDINRLVGDKVGFNVEEAKYKNDVEVEKYLQPDPSADPVEDFNVNRKKTPAPTIQMKTVTQNGVNVYDFNVTDTKQAGLYNYKFKQLPGEVLEERPYAFNVDAENESDLRRATNEKLERPPQGSDTRRGTLVLREFGQPPPSAETHKPDASELWWPYLLFLLILVVEQALAVHLSFHLRGDGGAAPMPAPA